MKLRRQRSADIAHMSMRIRKSRAIQLDALVPPQAEVRSLQRLLAGENKRRRKAALRERVRNGQKLDGFRPGSDDQPDIGETQPSP